MKKDSSLAAPLKQLVWRTVQNNFLWSCLNGSVVRFSHYAEYARRKTRPNRLLQEAVQAKVPDLVVRHGPFQGLKFPSLESTGGAVFPKLLGSYERELHPVVEEIRRVPYTEILNIGCSEGYYAVGLACLIPTAKVYAYDLDERAPALVRRLAELNGVADRVIPGSACTPETLLSLPYRGRALILCDCEGYEKTLFSEAVVAALAGHDLLIEVHDCYDITISATLRPRFSATHDLQVIESVDDIKKAYTYDYPELAGYGLAERRHLIGEGRPAIMDWFYLKARHPCSPRVG